MIFSRTRFGEPVLPAGLAPGDLFALSGGEAFWLGLRLRDDEHGTPLAMLLAGPDLHDERLPLPVDLLGVEEGLGRLPVERVFIEPWAEEPLAEPDLAQHGSLVLDGRGEMWMAYRRRSRPVTRYVSLQSFREGVPARPTLAYPRWRMVLRDAHGAHELAVFSPGGALS